MQNLSDILTTLRRDFEQLLGRRLEAIYLYGSRARGDAQPDSDIDILAVVRGSFNHMDLLEMTSPVTCGLSLENDVVISSAFISHDRFDNEKSPFILNVKREGIAI
ncbi:MAG: nucleotidyltransferase domain-containing protein [Anaerolineales bacterium]|nr:nucleotidyltransferase domain-containing protein [Anaerolineales bacterium]